MVTKDQALAARHGDEFHFGTCTRTIGPRGGIAEIRTRARVTGQCQTWVTRPTEFRLPVTHGMRDHGSIQAHNADNWHREQDCPLLATDGPV